MDAYIAFEAPAWLWIAASLSLVLFGLIIGYLACKVLGIGAVFVEYEDNAATKADTERELTKLHLRLTKLERPEPIPVRLDREPPTEVDPEPLVLPASGDTLPPGAWVTHVQT